MPSTATDLRYGRRGGGWLPSGYVPVDEQNAEHCDVCDGLLAAGQHDRHRSCEPVAAELFPDA